MKLDQKDRSWFKFWCISERKTWLQALAELAKVQEAKKKKKNHSRGFDPLTSCLWEKYAFHYTKYHSLHLLSSLEIIVLFVPLLEHIPSSTTDRKCHVSPLCILVLLEVHVSHLHVMHGFWGFQAFSMVYWIMSCVMWYLFQIKNTVIEFCSYLAMHGLSLNKD